MAELSPGARFRELLSGRPLILPGVFNAITAQTARAAGFPAVYMSGAGVTNSLTGYPDIALLTLTEMAQQAAYVARAARVPVIADADTGYGEIHNVMRAVEELERAGVAGIHLEDQTAPKRCGHLDGKQVISTPEMCRKIRAAVRARNDASFFLIARTDARGSLGLDHAIDRALRYLEAGADAIFAESLESEAEYAQFARCVDGPLVANMTEFGKTPYLTAAQFGELGFDIVLFPQTAFRVMMRSAEEVYKELYRSGTQVDLLDRMQTRAELYALIDYPAYQRLDSELASEVSE